MLVHLGNSAAVTQEQPGAADPPGHPQVLNRPPLAVEEHALRGEGAAARADQDSAHGPDAVGAAAALTAPNKSTSHAAVLGLGCGWNCPLVQLSRVSGCGRAGAQGEAAGWR